jgi:transforming growth factor-beta-induced protein
VETLKEILTYHVVGDAFLKTNLSKGLVATLLDDSSLTISVMGESIEVNDVTVTSADMVVSNGVILSIDEVLFPSSLNLPTLIDVASADSDFATLIVAVAAAELVDDLSAPGPFTLFAPNEAGFGLLPDGTVQTLTEDEDKAPLRDILLYHVVEGLVRTEDILEEGLASAPTMQGANLTFSVMDDGTIVVDGTPVLGTVITANGIVHVIGAVLTPPVEATMAPVETTMAPTTAPIPTMAPISAYGEKDRAWATSTFVAALVSVAALLMV